MEYYVYTTKHCNLSCRYCDGVGLTRLAGHDGSGPKDIRALAYFVERDLQSRGMERGNVVFYGGEPLLNPQFIEEFIGVSRAGSLNYVLHTNGTLLNKIDMDLLNKIPIIFVSIDGDAEQHDRNRGHGTYGKIMSNIRALHNRYKGETIARITLTPQSSLLKAVLGVAGDFDHVFWQLENSADPFESMDDYARVYADELSQLGELWIRYLHEGSVMRFVPFQAILRSLVLGEEYRTLRCGASGNSLAYIDTDGKCYVCDKLINQGEFCIGDIEKGITREDKYIHTEIRAECNVCTRRFICGGRCLAQLRFYAQEKFEYYCKCTRALMSVVESMVPRMSDALADPTMRELILSDAVTKLTEQIP
jgi:uncharacterized protein